MISLTNVRKRFGAKTVLEGISLTLPEAQTHVLLGASGSGKSTLLRLIAGLIDLDGGSLRVAGIEVSRKTQPELAERLGYVIQDGGLFPHLTGEDNVTLAARASGWTKEKIGARLSELGSLVGLEASALRRYPKDLSGGQRQRVGLMRAIFKDPGVYLLDEPLAALDPIIRAELQTELKRIFNQLRKTVLIVTHDVGEAAFFGHTITLLQNGKIAQHGTFADLVRRPASPFVTEFIHAQRPPPEIKELL